MSKMNEVNKRVDQGATIIGSMGEIAGAIKWFCIALVTVSVLGGGYWVVSKFTNIGGMVIDAGAAVYEAGAEGTTAAIESAGETAADVRESLGNAVTTATEGIDTEALAERASGAAEAADDAVDSTLGWLQQRRDQLGAALDGDEDTSINGVEGANE